MRQVGTTDVLSLLVRSYSQYFMRASDDGQSLDVAM